MKKYILHFYLTVSYRDESDAINFQMEVTFDDHAGWDETELVGNAIAASMTNVRYSYAEEVT